MSTVVVSIDVLATVVRLFDAAGVRQPVITFTGSDAGPLAAIPSPRTLTWTPDLSAPEQVLVTRAIRVATSAVSITPAEWATLENDIAGLQTYQDLPTPTLAQTVLAVKAQSRILKAILRS